MISSSASIVIRDVRHQYGDAPALNGVSLTISPGRIFALLGPNGSGKTTLFRLIATLMKLQSGEISVAGVDVARDPREVRRRIGIVFQNPSLDKKLTVQENIDYQGALYGLAGQRLIDRRELLLKRLELGDRRHDRCEKLSGGFKRRVDLARGMLHQPHVLLLDEPSTGLDPVARLQLWNALVTLSREGTTVLLTTHLLEEAEKAEEIAIMNTGTLIAQGAPEALRSEMGQGLITVIAEHPEQVQKWLKAELGVEATVVMGQLRIRDPRALAQVDRMVSQLGSQVRSITIGRPSLEDVFIAKTGRRFDFSEASSTTV